LHRTLPSWQTNPASANNARNQDLNAHDLTASEHGSDAIANTTLSDTAHDHSISVIANAEVSSTSVSSRVISTNADNASVNRRPPGVTLPPNTGSGNTASLNTSVNNTSVVSHPSGVINGPGINEPEVGTVITDIRNILAATYRLIAY